MFVDVRLDVYLGMCLLWCMLGDQRKTYRNQFSPAKKVLRITCRLSDLVPAIITSCSISLVPKGKCSRRVRNNIESVNGSDIISTILLYDS